MCKIARGKGIMLVSRFGTMVYTESSLKIKEIFFPFVLFFFSHRCLTNKNFCESLTRSCCVLSLFLRIIVVILNKPISLLYVFVICYLHLPYSFISLFGLFVVDSSSKPVVINIGRLEWALADSRPRPRLIPSRHYVFRGERRLDNELRRAKR